MRASRLVLAGLVALAFALLAWAFARRLPYPYDLEWMEGGMLCHALQASEGRPIYGPPSLRFVPFAYTPLYPLVLAALGKVFGLGYALGRAVSVLAFGSALAAAFALVRRSGGSVLVALAAPAVACAAFVPTGAWYDLVRVDSLFLALTVAGVLACLWPAPRGPVLAGALLAAAFLAKQTAAPFLLAAAASLFVARRRAVIAYLVGVAMVALPALWSLHLWSHGWFWTYAFGLHQRHGFDAARALLWTPLRLALLLGPGLALVPQALMRERTPALVLAVITALAGIAAACLGAGTEWSYLNALIPGVVFGAIAIGTAAASLEDRRATAWLLAASIATAAGGLAAAAAGVLPEPLRAELSLPTGYDPRPILPTRADREAGDRLIARLRAEPGAVLVPFHPYYAALAGKETSLHAMNLADLQGAGLGPPRDLVEAIRGHAFAVIVLDVEEGHGEEEALGLLPRLAGNYEVTERMAGPRVFSGGRFRPALIARPRGPRPDGTSVRIGP